MISPADGLKPHNFPSFEPRRLWSLWDMMRFYAASFSVVVRDLGVAELSIRGEECFGDGDYTQIKETISTVLRDSKKNIDELPLSRATRDQYEILVKAVSQMDGREIATRLSVLQRSLLNDLSSSYFLMIPESWRWHYQQPEPIFGTIVDDIFPDAKRDIAAAGRCLALDEWTACVFHLMRVLEHGLHAMAPMVGLTAEAISHENWKNAIDQIEKKIRALESLPKGADKERRITALSATAVQFRYFKDAWRNHVSHSRAHYDSRDAPLIWSHVRTFMEQLAKQVEEFKSEALASPEQPS